MGALKPPGISIPRRLGSRQGREKEEFVEAVTPLVTISLLI